jgi:hypothetical protein
MCMVPRQKPQFQQVSENILPIDFLVIEVAGFVKRHHDD